MTMKTEIATLFDQFTALKSAAEALSEAHEILHHQWLARSPVPAALRIDSLRDAAPVPHCFVRKDMGHDPEVLWISIEGWAASLKYCCDPQVKAECEAKLRIAENHKAESDGVKAELGYDAAYERALEQWALVDECRQQILAATPADSADLRIQGEFLVEDLRDYESDIDVVAHFVTNAVRLAA